MAVHANPVTLMLNCGVSRAHAQKRGGDLMLVVCAWVCVFPRRSSLFRRTGRQRPPAFRAPAARR